MQTKVIVINGYARSGKDEFVKYVQNLSKLKIINYSTIDTPKDVYLTIFGKDSNWTYKTPYFRKVLSDIKITLCKRNEYYVHEIQKLIDDKNDIIFVHAREPENIKQIVNRFKAKTLFINNKQAKDSYNKFLLQNEGDDNVENYVYDFYVDNDGTLDEFKNNIKFCWGDILERCEITN